MHLRALSGQIWKSTVLGTGFARLGKVFVFESGHQAGWEGNNAMDDVDRLALAAARETLQTDLDLHDEENLANFLAAEQVLAILDDNRPTLSNSSRYCTLA